MSNNDSYNSRDELLFPKTLTLFERMVLWIRGYLDARSGKLFLINNTAPSSLRCNNLMEDANARIIVEWQECNKTAFSIAGNLKVAIQESKEILNKIKELKKEENAFNMLLENVKYEGDNFVSEYLKTRRALRRKSLQIDKYSKEKEELMEKFYLAKNKVHELDMQLKDARDVAIMHERLVRLDYIARLSCYLRGASHVNRIGPNSVNDKALTTAPREENEELCLKLFAEISELEDMEL